MKSEILNITNGDCFNEYFISQYGGVAIPFCEVTKSIMSKFGFDKKYVIL